MASGRPVPTRSRLRSFLPTPRRGFRRAAWVILFLLIVTISYLIGRNTAPPNANPNAAIAAAEKENLALSEKNTSQGLTIAELQARLTNLQNEINELIPKKDAVYIGANQSVHVADGRLTIGLIGTPTNVSVSLNINGKPRPAAAGDIIDVPLDSSTTCRVAVISFDIVKGSVMVNATCPAAKP
jgi:hypothetical protein